jgi:hypothetical protein
MGNPKWVPKMRTQIEYPKWVPNSVPENEHKKCVPLNLRWGLIRRKVRVSPSTYIDSIYSRRNLPAFISFSFWVLPHRCCECESFWGSSIDFAVRNLGAHFGYVSWVLTFGTRFGSAVQEYILGTYFGNVFWVRILGTHFAYVFWLLILGILFGTHLGTTFG